MRRRTKGALSDSKYIATDINPNGSIGGSTQWTSGRKSSGEFAVISDVVSPSFERKMADGEIIMNPLEISKQFRSCTQDSWLLGPAPSWGSRKFEGNMVCEWSIPPSRPSWFDSRVNDAKEYTLVQAVAKMADPDALALVTLAEAKKTAKMMSRPFVAMEVLLRRILTRRARLMDEGRNAVDALAKAWLEYRLGWKPVLYDIEGIQKAYKHAESQKPVRLIARSSTTIDWKQTVVTKTVKPQTSLVTMRGEFQHQTKVSSGVVYDVSEQTLADARNEAFGLRLRDIPATVWELTPWSFILDRFIDVGSWLNAITPNPSVTLKGSWTTTVERQRNHHTVVELLINAGTPLTSMRADGGLYVEDFDVINRIANPKVPLLPAWNPKLLTFQQTLDHYALLMSMLRKVKN